MSFCNVFFLRFITIILEKIKKIDFKTPKKGKHRTQKYQQNPSQLKTTKKQ